MSRYNNASSGSDDDNDDDYSHRASIFSEKPSTVFTRPSTVPSKTSSFSSSGNPPTLSKIGKALRTTHNENLQQDTYNLKLLSESLSQNLDQFDSKSPTLISEALNKFDPPLHPQNFFSSVNKPYINNIVRVILTLVDNTLATNETYKTSRFMVLKSFYQFSMRCTGGNFDANFTSTMDWADENNNNNWVVPEPSNFCLLDEGNSKISEIMDVLATSDSTIIGDQDGAFLAPVSRGISQDLSIPTIICGFPKPKPEHFEQVKQLCSSFNDIHFVIQKNYIKTCSTPLPPSQQQQQLPQNVGSPFVEPNSNFGGIAPPFRIPQDPNNIPISLSIAANINSKLSGTLGGYIYPKIDVKKNHVLAEDAKATYAMTCAHVCIDDSTSHPYVSVPSPVLVRLYKEALFNERNKYPEYTQEYMGYDSAFKYLENRFPHDANNNNSLNTFGRVIFGERSIVDGRLSDIAIIKCNPDVNCINHLGTDFPFSQYDPALMFGNLQIKKVISKIKPGSPVFKFGSTTNFTKGKLNKPKLVYWADNRIQSSEFVIASDKPGFASGGDSGAWILQKLEDFESYTNSPNPQQQVPNRPLNTIYEGNSNTKEQTPTGDEVLSGLGVVGMLHAYDGEFKQFGLYSPIVLILNRLQELTKVPWGVVGVLEDKDDEEDDEESSEGEDYDDDEEDEEDED